MDAVDFLESTDARPRIGWRGIALGLAAGAMLFAVGLVVARSYLPEWRLEELPSRQEMKTAFERLVGRAGVTLVDEPRLMVVAARSAPNNAYDAFGSEGTEWAFARRRPVMISAKAAAESAEAGRVEFSSEFGLDGRPWSVTFERSGFWAKFRPISETAFPSVEHLLLDERERLGVTGRGSFAGSPLLGADIVGGSPMPETLLWLENRAGPAWNAQRVPGNSEHALEFSSLRPLVLRLGLLAVLLLVVMVMSFVLAVRRRIDFVNAGVVTGLALIVSLTSAFLRSSTPSGWLVHLVLMLLSTIYLFFLWAAGESWLRLTGRETSSALDSLRSGRVGRRVGRAVFWGLALGAAGAGWYLLAYSAATVVPGGVPEESSVQLPLLRPGATPLDYGFGLAGLVLVALAVGRQFFPRFAVPVSVVVGAGVILPALSGLRPWPLALVFALGLAGLLVFAFERAGSLALAVTGVVTYLLPLFAFSLQSPEWFGAGLWSSVAMLTGLGVVGLVGAFRPESVREAVEAPGFVRRIAEEERVQYEMGLLARMQEGLLPHELPRVEGWEFAARTIQAHEVGGDFYDFFPEPGGILWIAAGDVAGHGVSCSITHAMTKAALAAVIRPGETPASVLGEVDRVLRTLTTSRLFTSLALVRLDPATGDALFANAGYPYPLRREGREITELALPGLPVGEGPARRYRDLEVNVPPGGALVFCSDGLFEALRADGEPYGFDRPRQVLAAAPSRSAEDLLHALAIDWHQAIGERAEDDTTLLVLRRRG